MWRPKGWEEIKPRSSYELGKQTYDSILGKNAFKEGVEAGADAIVRVLWKMAEESPTKTFTIDSRGVNVFGNIEL